MQIVRTDDKTKKLSCFCVKNKTKILLLTLNGNSYDKIVGSETEFIGDDGVSNFIERT